MVMVSAVTESNARDEALRHVKNIRTFREQPRQPHPRRKTNRLTPWFLPGGVSQPTAGVRCAIAGSAGTYGFALTDACSTGRNRGPVRR